MYINSKQSLDLQHFPFKSRTRSSAKVNGQKHLVKMAHQLTLFQLVDSQNPSTSGVNLAQEDDRSSNHGDFGPASPPGTLRDEDSSDSEGSCETSRHSVPGKQTNG